MDKEQRAVIAAIAISLITNKRIKNIYSYEQSKYINVSGTISATKVNVYDYDRSCYITGTTSSPNNFTLFDYGKSAYINLKIDGNKFSGYDYGSSNYYNGKISGNSASFYDYEASQYYNYST